jgi:cell division protein FtsW
MTIASQQSDKYLVWAVLVLGAMGVVAVYSATAYLARTQPGSSAEGFLVQHLARLGVALGAMGLFSLIDYHWIARVGRAALIGALVLLAVAGLVGVESGGAARWLQLGPVSVQPSGLVRLALVVYLAQLLVRKQEYIKSLERSFLPVFFWIFLAVALIGWQDLSTAAVVFGVAVLMCFVGRASLLHLGGLGALGVVLAGVLLVGSPERAVRIEAYLGRDLFPHTDTEQVQSTRGGGYQVQQAQIAIALGGLTGVGPGKSTQRDFLPAPYNDFIFAIVAEEYGLLGAFALLACLGIVLFRGYLRIARPAPDPLGLVLAVGLTTMLAVYGFVHAGVACGLLPATGLPLPFVSYGGTSMFVSGTMAGILLNISRQSNIE